MALFWFRSDLFDVLIYYTYFMIKNNIINAKHLVLSVPFFYDKNEIANSNNNIKNKCNVYMQYYKVNPSNGGSLMFTFSNEIDTYLVHIFISAAVLFIYYHFNLRVSWFWDNMINPVLLVPFSDDKNEILNIAD